MCLSLKEFFNHIVHTREIPHRYLEFKEKKAMSSMWKYRV
jgi:hypothetical protein